MEGALCLDDLAARVTGEDAGRVARSADAVRRTSCSLDVRLNAALDEAVGELVAPIPDARLSESTRQRVWVDRRRAAVGAWYELFPRSFGGFGGASQPLDYVADLGFDVVYLPPIHPIGSTQNRQSVV